ncbi:MAG: T9SS type A sorting domain-containing protein [Ignavibacteria bacterium]|nr:T9SS type A sorting domain-containing protein [Ignavibacteria bacterium]
MQNNIIFSVLILLLSILSLYAQSTTNKISSIVRGENYRIYPSNVTQTEVFIVKSPVDENILFSSGNTLNFIPFFISEGIYVTTNGGNSWQGNDTCTGEPISFHGGDPGVTIDKNGTFIITRLGRSPFAGLYSHYSADNGQTWSVQKVISIDDLERATLTTDAITTSSFYGRSHAAWVRFNIPFSVWFAYTDDGAQSWSSPQQINNPSPTSRSAGGDMAIGPNGEVYACWAGVINEFPAKEILVGFASSINGGDDWNVKENAFHVNGITGLLKNKANIRVNGLPSIAVDTTNGQRRGWIYIVTGQKDLAPAGSDPDIILNRSTDGGQTWSSAIRVNQDDVNNGKTQYFPTVHIDKFGAINIIFYSDRNTTNDSSGVFLARSTDGGDSWIEFEISDHNYKPMPIGGLGQGYQGDNIDITSTSTNLWPVWMDNSTGIYQIWTTSIEFTTVDVEDITSPLSSFELKQNYPNPFNPITKIGYQIKEQGFVSLIVFDALGMELVKLVQEHKIPGYYEVEYGNANLLKSKNLSSGIYFYRLSVNGNYDTKSMVLLK